MLASDWLEAAVTVPHGLQRVYAGTLIFILAASLIVVFGRYGFPPTLARKAYNAFNAPRAQTRGRTSTAACSASPETGGREQFHTAWQQVTDHPVLGGGAGSFADYWFQHRRVSATVHDAHNLYLETLAELGAPGLVLLVLVLGIPLAAVDEPGRHPSPRSPAALTWPFSSTRSIDWDWEMPAVTLSALFCGLALLAAARREGEPRVAPSTACAWPLWS